MQIHIIIENRTEFRDLKMAQKDPLEIPVP